ncbi:MAG: dephospho-CoA kinase [Alphaproteobacteria bacterium]|nr:dephospho-CoA kinase [Alphaproteobacteria bacterium]
MKKTFASQKSFFVIGLTGSIGMGKTTAAKILKGLGLSVFDADKAVHALMRKGGKAVKPIATLFPEAVESGAIQRRKLGHAVFQDPGRLKKLEKILHPLVRGDERAFLARARRRGGAAVLEIPLLFETGAEKLCDVVFCVTAPRAVQRERVLKRRGMTPSKFEAILKRQMPDKEKRKRADVVIDTSKGLAPTRRKIEKIVKKLQEKKHA